MVTVSLSYQNKSILNLCKNAVGQKQQERQRKYTEVLNSRRKSRVSYQIQPTTPFSGQAI